MNQTLQQFDVDLYIGQVDLTNGKKLNVPKISMKKIIRIAKFLGMDAFRTYENMQDVIRDSEMDDTSKVIMLMDSLKEEQLIHIFSILLDKEDQETLNLDLNEMLDIILVYLDKTNISKTFTQVRQIYQKLFKKDLPDISMWIQQKVQAQQKLQEKRQEAMQAAGNQS